MSYCNSKTSRKIAVLTTLATIAVVIIHSNSLESYRESAWLFGIGNGIAFLQHWAVPFFFMVSGFFFDRAFDDGPLIGGYSSFLFKKLRTLGMPYLLWGSVSRLSSISNKVPSFFQERYLLRMEFGML